MTTNEAIKYLEKHGFVSDDVKDIAIKALEKQIPKKPVYQEEREKCPSCGSLYIENYCAKCGQKIKWY